MADENNNENEEFENEGAEGQEGASGGEWTPPSKEDWDKLQESLRKARRDARQAKKTGQSETKGGDGQGGDAPDVEEVKRSAAAEVESRYKPMLVRQAARAAFTEAGLILPKGKTDQALSRVMKLIDTEEIEISEDGEIEGLADQIAEIRSEFPELFARRGSRSVDAGDQGGTGNGRAKSSAEKLAKALLG